MINLSVDPSRVDTVQESNMSDLLHRQFLRQTCGPVAEDDITGFLTDGNHNHQPSPLVDTTLSYSPRNDGNGMKTQNKQVKNLGEGVAVSETCNTPALHSVTELLLW